MMDESMDTDRLARAIVANLPRIPLDVTLWTRDECAAYLRVEPATMAEIVALPDFPMPTRVTASDSNRGPSNRRWYAGEVIEWAKNRQG